MPPTYQDVEQVIREVTGVASASIGAVGGTGRGRLRIRLETGQDPDVVSKAVARTLHERFGLDIDPAAIRPRAAEEDDVDEPTPVAPEAGATVAPERSASVLTGADAYASRNGHAATPPPAPDPGPDSDSGPGPDPGSGPGPTPVPSSEEPPTPPEPDPAPAPRDTPDSDQPARGAVVGFGRPLIQALSVGAEGLEVHVQAVLSMDDRELRGRATGAATRRATLRAVARATLDAVEQLFPGRVKTELESLELSHDGEDELCTTAVTFLTDEGAEKLIGVSMVRGDTEHAVMRATLDAVNRRIGLMLEEATAR